MEMCERLLSEKGLLNALERLRVYPTGSALRLKLSGLVATLGTFEGLELR